jgi:FAD/FMN-containing dehydrogenase
VIDEARLKAIVGAENLSSDGPSLARYSSDMSFVPAMKPEYVVRPRATREIEHLVKLAREARTGLVPVSSGPPHFRGDTVPAASGSVIVDLSRMKRIIRVDRLNRSVVFEPGVTFAELVPAVEEAGLRLNLPLLPRKTKSVVGSLLEREPPVMPKYHWDISDPAGCFEVVFGSGDVFRTGAAAGPGSLEDQWEAGGAQKEAAGPSASSWYRLLQGAQGTMGIVCWASARCEIVPVLEEPFLVGSGHLETILEFVHWLLRLRLVNECLILNGLNLAIIMAETRPGDFSDLHRHLPPWVLFFNIAAYDYLPELRMKGQVQDMLRLAQKSGLQALKDMAGISSSNMLQRLRHSYPEPCWKMRHKGASQDILFVTTSEKIPTLISTLFKAAERLAFPIEDIGIYLQPIVQGVNYHCEFTLFYDPEETGAVQKVKQLCATAPLNLTSKGAFFSRPYGDNTRAVMERDPATLAALHKVKTILDPDNILNPGKLCY